MVSVNGKGLNAKGANALQILTEAAYINAGVWANEVDVRTGKNVVDANTLDTQRIGTSNQVGLDVAAIGGMYANAITMKGSNTGLGVNVKGVVSSAKATNITSDGRIIVSGGVTSNGNMVIASQAVAVGRSGIVQGDAGTTVDSQTTVDNAGLIDSGGTTHVEAGTLDNHDGGRVYGDAVSIKANHVNNHTNRELEERYHKAGDALKAAKKALDDEWNADVTVYKTQEELAAHKQRIQHLTKAYDEVQTQLTAIETEFAGHTSGTIAGRKEVDVDAKHVTNKGRGLIYSGGSMSVTAKEDLTNTGATIKSAGAMTIDAPEVKNENAAFGAKRVSDGVTKNPDKLKVNDPNHKLEGQVFDKSEFPYADDSSGYGTPRVIPVHSEKDEAYNKEMNKGENRVHKFTIIRSQAEHTHTDITHDDPGVISSGGDMTVSGAIHNTNSRIVAGGTVRTSGKIDNQSDEVSEKTISTGTTQESYTRRVRKSHGIGHKRRRAWNAEVFMTPSITEQNVKPIGVIKDHAEDALSTSTIAKVNDSLDPYGLGKGNGKRSGIIDGLSLPTESLYRIHPEITANALVETDPAFTDRKQFLSSQYMIDALNQDPDRRLKRLGDGFYEQQLVNQQILATTGRQYLTGYSDNEAEYKALLEAGIAYGKQFNLTPGITLSDAQMQAITTDMVWLETKTMVVNGKEQQVLYPKVYLAKQSAKSLDAMGGLISGRAIVSETDADIRNQGVMTADTIVLNGQNIHNTGTIDGRTVAIAAKQDVNTTGAIHGDAHVVVRAGRDVNVGARVKALSNQDVVRRQGTVGVSEPGGQLSIAANRDIHLKGALVHGGVNTTMDITAGHDVNLGTEQLAAKKDMTVNGDNYNRMERRTELGTTILGDGDVAIRAGHDVSVRNGVVNSEQGTTMMAAGHDVDVTPGESYSRDEYGIKYKEKSLLSKTVRTLRTDHEHTGVLSSTIGGNAVDMKANHDVSLTGSNVLGTKDVNITAGHDVRTDSGEERQRDDIYEHSKKTGLMSAGIGFTIGSKKVTDTLDGKYTNQVETLIGAAKGKVAIHANEVAHLTSASILAGTDATVQAPNMVLDGKHNTADIKQTHEVKTSGLTVSLGGSIASALNGAYALQQKGKDRHDKRLAALEYVEAGKELRKGLTNINEYRAYTPANVVNHAGSLMDSGLQKMDFSARLDRLASSGQLTEKQLKTVTGIRDRFAVEGAQEYQTGFNEMADIQGDQSQYKAQKRAKKDGLANIHVGIGSSYSKSVTELHNRDYAGGKIISNNTTSLLAKSNAPNTGTITAIGEMIQGKTVDVVADNTINLQAATNTSRKIENNDTKSWSVGANISVNGGGILGFDANYNKGMQRENTEKVSYAPSRITANTVNMNSGKDTNVIGSTVKGDKVIANVGGNLYIQSLQDKEIYVGKQKNTGFSVSTNGTQLGSISGEHSKGDMRSNYASVTEQAGIFAGKDGYTITTKGTTTLEGAVIDSKAAAEKNTVSTGRLAMKDIENKAEYSSKNTGISYNHIGNFKSLSQAGQDAVYNSLGLLPKLLPESKDSAHSTTKSAIADGTITVHDESVDIRLISRNTVNSLNKLDKIFDKKKVEERQELARLFAKDAFEQLHYWEPKTKEEKVAKAIAHGVVAEVSARVAGNKPGSGFYTGVTNEALIGEIQKVAKTNPAVAQWLSAGVGAVVNAGLGKPVITGVAEAQYGTRDNAYGRMKQPDELSELNFSYYYIIALDGGVYKRSRTGDELVDPSILSTDFISGVVVQNPEKGHQLEGQEVFINSDLSWTNIDEPMGHVHPWNEWTYKLKGQAKSQGEYSEAFSRAVSEEIKRRNNEPYVKDTWYDKDTLLAYNEYSDGSIVSLGMTWGQLLETQGYPTKLGSDGAFYTGSSTTGWHYNPKPSLEAARHAETEYFKNNKNKDLINAMFKHSTDDVNIELSRIEKGKEHSMNLFGVVYKVRAGDKPNTVYRTIGANLGLNLTKLLKVSGVIKDSIPDTYIVDNSENSGIAFLGMGFDKTRVPFDNRDIDTNNSRFKVLHTALDFNDSNSIVTLKKVEDSNYNIYGPDQIRNHTVYDISNYMNTVPIGIEAEYTNTYKVKSDVSEEDEALVSKSLPNMDIENMRAEAAAAIYRGQGKKYINRNDGKKYFIKEGKYGQKDVYTNSRTFVSIKKSIFDEDFYEEESDDR